MARLAATLLAMTLPWAGAVVACTDPVEPDVVARLDEADSVSVVRLTSLTAGPPGSREIIGEVELAYSLLGEPAFRRLSFLDTHCGGLQLVVGRYFLIATRHEGEVLPLRAGDDSIVDLSRHYAMPSAPMPEPRSLPWHVANHLEGIPMPEREAKALNWAVPYSQPPPPPGPAQDPRP